MQEVLDAAVPTHPAKCVFIVIKKLLIILIMIKSDITRIIVSMMILAEFKYQTERQLCLYISFITFSKKNKRTNQ